MWRPAESVLAELDVLGGTDDGVEVETLKGAVGDASHWLNRTVVAPTTLVAITICPVAASQGFPGVHRGGRPSCVAIAAQMMCASGNGASSTLFAVKSRALSPRAIGRCRPSLRRISRTLAPGGSRDYQTRRERHRGVAPNRHRSQLAIAHALLGAS